MPNTHATLRALFSDIADAIRAKTGETGTIIADQFPEAIASISGGGGGTDVEDALLTRYITECTNDRVSRIGPYVFTSNISITSVSFGAATSIGAYAFLGCTKLKTANFPAAKIIASSAFRGCTSLLTISFPDATTISAQAFSSCSSLKSVDFPKVTVVGQAAFESCIHLSIIKFRKRVSISAAAFEGCKSLYSLYLLTKSLCTLDGTNAFTNTPIASNTGTIYVPSAWVTSYKNATNWTHFSSRLSGLTDAQIAAL